MILQKLYEFAQREQLVGDPDYEPKPVAWIVTIDKGGKLLGIKGTHYTPEAKRKRKPKPVAQTIAIPRQEGRTSGAFAFFLVDKAEYVLGIDPAGKRKTEQLQQRAGLFRERAQQCAEETGDEGVEAVLTFLKTLARQDTDFPIPDELAANDLICFRYAPDGQTLLHARSAVQSYWHDQRSLSTEEDCNRLCLVTGQNTQTVDKHPPLKRVPGGVSSGVSLVSFNARAFESYGLSGNENAPIGRNASEACATALNRLLHPNYPNPHDSTSTLPEQKIQLSDDTVVVFWTDGDSGLAGFLPGLLQVRPDMVKHAYHSIWSGTPPQLDASKQERFYALSLMGAQGRAAVRGWFTTHVGDLMNHLAEWFDDIHVVYNTPPPKKQKHPPRMPIRDLIDSLGVRGKDIPSPLANALIESTWSGRPLPLAVLQRALLRTRAEIGQHDWLDLRKRDARAALIKAVLSRTLKKEVTPAMDPNNTHPGYLCGRLMAVLERIQETAHGGSVNATVVDRYFSAASATPARVMPNLLRMMRTHISKAKREHNKFIFSQSKLADEVVAQIGQLPTTLGLEQQGWFVLGYHHQRHAFFQKKETPAMAETSEA